MEIVIQIVYGFGFGVGFILAVATMKKVFGLGLT